MFQLKHVYFLRAFVINQKRKLTSLGYKYLTEKCLDLEQKIQPLGVKVRDIVLILIFDIQYETHLMTSTLLLNRSLWIKMEQLGSKLMKLRLKIKHKRRDFTNDRHMKNSLRLIQNKICKVFLIWFWIPNLEA